jgi:hypothetical protein
MKYIHNTYEYGCTLKNTDVPVRNHVRQTVRIAYVFVRIRTYCVRIFVRICTYRTYSYVSLTQRDFDKQYVRNTYDTYDTYANTYKNTYANTYDTYTTVFFRASSYSYVFVRIFVRIRTYRTYMYVLWHKLTQLVSILRHLLC